MKRLTLLFLTLALTACGLVPSAGSPTPISPIGTVAAPVDLTPAQLSALTTLSESSGVPLEQITFISTEAVDWPDSCLGVVRAGMGCAEAITPGFRIVLEAKGFRYEYHTNQAGTVIAPATLALVWHREGGIAGFCDDLYIYLSGEAYGSSCKNGDLYPAGKLTVDDLAQLESWVKTFGPAAFQMKDPAVADAMSTTVTFSGRGTGQPAAADQTAISSWAQAIYDRVKPCC